MLHTLLGWSDGLMLMMAEEDRLVELLGVMEEKRRELIRHMAADFSHSLFWAPDNLDGQFISPAVFESRLASSYQKTCEILHQRDNCLWVHSAPTIKCFIDCENPAKASHLIRKLKPRYFGNQQGVGLVFLSY
jgi:hypothetical protein